MQVKLASEIMRVPAMGYLAPVHVDRLPWERAAKIVERANRDRTDRRKLDEPSPVSPLEIALAAALLYYELDFAAQVPIGVFDADFVVSGWLVLEVDGKAYHDKKRDRTRDSIMERDGFNVLRFSGRSVYQDPLRCAREAIRYRDRQLDLLEERVLAMESDAA
jgi:very-short-patch-repair endonuclease